MESAILILNSSDAYKRNFALQRLYYSTRININIERSSNTKRESQGEICERN